MSVLRMRLPRAIPAAGMLVGVLALGLAGCGGGEGGGNIIPGPVLPPAPNVTIPASAQPVVTSTAPQTVTPNATATLTAPAPATGTGIVAATAVVTPGTVSQDTPLEIAVVPLPEQIVTKNPAIASQVKAAGFTPITEIVVGTVSATDKTLKPPALNKPVPVTIEADQATLAQIQNQLQSGQFQLLVLGVNPATNKLETRGTAQIQKDTTTGKLVIVLNAGPGDNFLTLGPLSAHQQGGIH